MESETFKKMRTFALITCSLLLVPSLFAAPAKGGGAEVVAEGYPAWTGVVPKNYIMGRTLLSSSDLRQRVATIIVEFDAAKAADQIEATGTLGELLDFMPGTLTWDSRGWETFTIPRDVMVVYVARNAKDHDAIKKAVKVTDTATQPGRNTFYLTAPATYANLTFEGAPDTTDKLPFVYMLGYDGKELLVQEKYDSKTTKKNLRTAIAAQRKKLDEAGLKWRPYYGYVAEPKHFKDVERALKAGKPLEGIEVKMQKSFKATDAEKAKEAQMLYDALEQTKSEMINQVKYEAKDAPHVAAYHIGEVLKYWPKMKKATAEASDALKANSAAKPLVAMYPKLVLWGSPDFMCKNAGEAKKIVAELNKMKKSLEPLKEDSKNITVQNGALILDGMLDELISIIPTKVPQK